MNFKASLLLIISFFLLQSIYAQDTVKRIDKGTKANKKHSIKKQRSDSLKSITARREKFVKDTSRRKPVIMPKYLRDGYIAIGRGFGVPNNSFVSTGNAANGKVYSVSAALPGVISHCGLAFKFDYGSNGLNETQLQASLNSNNQASFPNINTSLAGAVGQYTYTTLLTGVCLTYPAKHFTIDARILGGVMFAIVPNLTVNYYDQTSGNNGVYYQATTSGNAFCFDMGIGIRYAVLSKLYVMITADYLTASPSFNYVTTGAGLSSTGGIVEENGRQSIAGQSFDLSNFTFGIGYTISAQKRSTVKSN
ncbi:MAG TPA: hypothetical protein VK809_10510 [Bacteroidia bacterium]|jgi:hypothetical protein|nr:hypothetical protein [Bacteroidia bacterium]